MAAVVSATTLEQRGRQLVVVKRRVASGTRGAVTSGGVASTGAVDDRAWDDAVSATAAEARWLMAARPAAVVRVHHVGAGTRLETKLAGTTTLRTMAPVLAGQPRRASRLLAAVADVVDQLHRIGLVHGNLDLDHGIVAGPARDRVTLCSPTGSGRGPAADIAALGRLAATLMASWDAPPPGWSDIIAEAEADADRLGARHLAGRFGRLAERRLLLSPPDRWRRLRASW